VLWGLFVIRDRPFRSQLRGHPIATGATLSGASFSGCPMMGVELRVASL
jgi:hypothetical protein